MVFSSAKQWAGELLSDLFHPVEKAQHRWFIWLLILLLYLGGAAVWISFYQKGTFPVSFHDWADIAAPRLYFLKDALAQGVLPLHISNPAALGGVTDRYLAVPNTIVSPQVILLDFMSITQFVMANQLILYSIGFVGLLALRKRFGLSWMAFAAVFLLFDFNGHIIAHSSVGHTSWGGYFFYPWFALLIFDLLDGDRSWAWVARTAGLLLLVFLQGSYHQWIWMLLFLGALALGTWRLFTPIFKAGLFAGLLALVRLLPPAMLVSKFEETYQYMGGYPTLGDIWQSLTTIQLPGIYVSAPYIPIPIGTWEFDLYVGLTGALFVLFFGGYLWLRRRRETPQYSPLVVPILALTALSVGEVFWVFHHSSIPLFAGERVSARMISVPLVFLVILAAFQFQRWLNRHPVSLASGAIQGLVLLTGTHDLWQHFQAWTIARSAVSFPMSPVTASAWKVANHPDQPYVQALAVGLVGSGLAAMVLAGLVWNERRSAPAPRPARPAKPRVAVRPEYYSFWSRLKSPPARREPVWARQLVAEPVRRQRIQTHWWREKGLTGRDRRG